MRMALYQPDIPQNTGTILRLGACLGVHVDIIGPTGFDMSDRALKRAGLDYIDAASLKRHVSFEVFEVARKLEGSRLVLSTTKAALPYFAFDFAQGDILLFGRESAGVPDKVHDVADARICIPMRPGHRSLNVAVTAGIVVSEALRQTHGFSRLAPPPLPPPGDM